MIRYLLCLFGFHVVEREPAQEGPCVVRCNQCGKSFFRNVVAAKPTGESRG
jgi:hypothetical protein